MNLQIGERRGLRAALLALLAAAVVLSSGILGAQAPEKKADAEPPAAPAANQPAAYVGSQTCQPCHEDIYNAFQKNPHIAVETDKKRGWEAKACEMCHGPGSKHAESASATDIRNAAKLAAGQTDQTCLTCHLNQPTHAGRIQSAHAKNQVSCVTCHSIHKNGPHGLVARKVTEINEQCATCHSAVMAQFNRPYKHRVLENAMSCVDCHNPHGEFRRQPVRAANANEPGCLNCHGDKRGPFVFEHAPVRFEGCNTCHEPHGSANPRMLTRQEVRYVCLECHSNIAAPRPGAGQALGGVPPAFHDLRTARFRNCTICHQKIHGSYVDRTFVR